jgi:Icc-related predicted phosphoesterase
MNDALPICVRVLTATDLHQSRLLYGGLTEAVRKHSPDVVAVVGDALEAFSRSGKRRLSAEECAQILADLPIEHILFTRGNHEDTNWSAFAYAWPHERRRLIGLYGTAYTVGPLRIVGFPCATGSEETWCEHLSASGDTMMLYAAQHRKPLPLDTHTWLPGLMRQCGPSARTLWLMRECPMGLPIANPRVYNPNWTAAVERYSPIVTVSGHDHETPLESGLWHALLGGTRCINVGQAETVLHYAVLDFEFEDSSPRLPSETIVKAFPWGSEVVI